MKQNKYNLLLVGILVFISISVYGQAGTITLNQYCAAGYTITWPIDVKEAKTVRIEYLIDITLSSDNFTIQENSSMSPFLQTNGYQSSTICTNLKTGTAVFSFTAHTSGNKAITIKYSADNPLTTGSDLRVGGNANVSGTVYVTGTTTLRSSVGIGISTPRAQLHVNGKQIIGSGSQTAISGNSSLQIQQNATNETSMNFWQNGIAKAIIGSKPNDPNFYITNDNNSGGLGLANHSITLDINGNVGIGTTAAPLAKLQILKYDTCTNLSLRNGAALDIWNQNATVNTGGQINFRSDASTASTGIGAVIGYLNKGSNVIGSAGNLVFGVKNSYADASIIQAMTIQQGGFVGIGTTAPTTKLDVNGIINTNADIQLGVSQVNSYVKMNTDSRKWWVGVGVLGGDDKFAIFDATANYHALTIGTDGNIGIGIGRANAVYKLEVNGTVHAKEVIVDTNVPFADYVFNSNYKLMPLYEVERYVNKNSHLPEIPSAAEIKKNGLNMGEMQNKLLQKVEELTLYVIEQQKEINQLKRELRK